MIFLQEGTAQTLPATRRLKNETIGVLVFPLDQLVHTYLKFLARSEPYDFVLALNLIHLCRDARATPMHNPQRNKIRFYSQGGRTNSNKNPFLRF